MGTCAYPIKNIQDPITSGVHACLQAVIFAEEMDFDNLCSEGDELAILKRIKTQKSDRSIPVLSQAWRIEQPTRWQVGDDSVKARDTGWKKPLQKMRLSS
ncbi:hypothetical protein Gohar_018998 [Gossypium harknessii]|uniref:RNase H type-1 domain-containing protein n=1 Tax=Gossypium harknessii TaxID=34285 RepID=A0A7J9GB34_9ROSI|nr:hypothetical protein [Gossypium harknessii]